MYIYSKQKEEKMSAIKDIEKIIATINPKEYYDYDNPSDLKEFIKLKKEEGFDRAVDDAKPSPLKSHQIIYDSSTEGLEPVYYWILDFMNNKFGRVDKLTDNFTSSPASGHFSEQMGKATRMQEQAMKILGQVNEIVKSILNLIYDLKDFEMRLQHYEDAKSSDSEKAESGLLSLKQIWMDNVDAQKGNGSINMMAQKMQFVTLRDAFMAVESPEKVEELDLNERVKRILKVKVKDFFEWKKRSEKELKKRFQIEKRYLKSQVDSLKLYTKWARPYLKAANQLEQSEELGERPAHVNAFDTTLLELTLFGQDKVGVKSAVNEGDLPENFVKLEDKMRKYFSCVLVDLYFRGIPQRIQQRQGGHYTFGGRVEIRFKGYALNEEEIKKVKDKVKEKEMEDSLKLVEGVTKDSLGQIKEDIEHFLEDDEEEEETKRKKEDVNPFSALLGLNKSSKSSNKKKEKEDKEDKIGDIKGDSYEEKLVRDHTKEEAEGDCFTVYDIYKKAHGMMTPPNPDFLKQ